MRVKTPDYAGQLCGRIIFYAGQNPPIMRKIMRLKNSLCKHQKVRKKMDKNRKYLKKKIKKKSRKGSFKYGKMREKRRGN